jgi:hypothetical protein
MPGSPRLPETVPILPAPGLRLFATLEVTLGPPREIGAGRAGRRRIVPIIGGRVEGPGISGRILNLGADWQTIFGDGVAHLDTRYAFETDEGAVIEIINRGLRHGPAEVIAALARGEAMPPENYYMRTHATLETGDPRYEWVNRALFLGTGARLKSAVVMTLYQVL